MNRNRQSILTLIFGVLVSSHAAQSQTALAILQVDVQNYVSYVEDTADFTKFATLPNVTSSVPLKNFYQSVQIADIVAVNGQPVKGTLTAHNRRFGLTATPNPGDAIADTSRPSHGAFVFEFLASNGTAIGSLMTIGLAGLGTPPPGSPPGQTQGNNVITGGTGAFFGARGTQGQIVTAQTIATRSASIMEDPANRRINGGGRARFLLEVIPMAVPEILADARGPEILHSDFSRVTKAKPGVPGEVLTVKATGMGPTVPGVGPGLPFPADSPQPVNSPVGVTVNGQSAEVVNAIGWPGYVGVYRVDFQLPDTAATGTVSIQLSAAWIPGPTVSIPIQ
jgi:uncharacterized protein (TIGR03437 family)